MAKRITAGNRSHIGKGPHDFYDQIEVPTGAEWKRFEFVFTPEMDCMAWIMFVVKDAGTVDLAGITVREKP